MLAPIAVREHIWPQTLAHQRPIVCPVCGEFVSGFVRSEYKATGKLGFFLGRHTLYPCFCKVDFSWLHSFIQEMQRRINKAAPLAIDKTVTLTRKALRQAIDKQLRALYRQRSAAVLVSAFKRKEVLEREIVQLITELEVLCPGNLASVAPMTLEPVVNKWARKEKLLLPAGNAAEKSEAGRIRTDQIYNYLCSSEDFRDRPRPQLKGLAEAMHKELQEFVAKNKPVSQSTLAVIVALVPAAAQFINDSDEIDPVVVADAKTQFADTFTRRRRRRMDIQAPE